MTAAAAPTTSRADVRADHGVARGSGHHAVAALKSTLARQPAPSAPDSADRFGAATRRWALMRTRTRRALALDVPSAGSGEPARAVSELHGLLPTLEELV